MLIVLDSELSLKLVCIPGESTQDNGYDSDDQMQIVEDGEKSGEEEEGQDGGDIKDRLLKMSIGVPNLLSLNLPENTDPKEQLKIIGETIMQLTSNLAKVGKPSSIQELSILQATLLSLQQNQLIQFHLILQVHQTSTDSNSVLETAAKLGIQNPFLTQLAEKERTESTIPEEKSISGFDVRRERELFPLPSSANIPLFPKFNILEPENSVRNSENHNDSSFTSSIIRDQESGGERPVNTLELLQQKAQGILNSASKGVLANNMTDMGNCGSPVGKDEGGIKHRCKYCGKVFGSDSALQIHIRSHTGERPYKCNVCGNRFTTKGNLKVHFQRHSDRFPVVKMNPNMVPEHLDKFYPSLLQQCEEAEKKGSPMPNINNPIAGMNPVVPPGMTMPTNLPGMPPPVSSLHQQMQLPKFPTPLTGGALPRYPLPLEPLRKEDIHSDKPAWLRNLPILPKPSSPPSLNFPPGGLKREVKEEKDEDEVGFTPKLYSGEDLSSIPRRRESEKREHSPYDDSRIRREFSRLSESGDSAVQEEPENLSSDKRDESKSPLSESTEDKFIFRPGMAPLRLPQFPVVPGHLLNPLLRSQESNLDSPRGQISLPHNLDPTKDPNLYNTLLPLPGSTDNAWETLIEVDKANETTKLESLVDNIGNQQNEPNECLICNKVLSCKSALQMHYRTHTGARPYKCKICKRTFTTKGNLKTHMSVHRTKPPMRSFPQCPVCHKKYPNPIILQQHIRTHTGEKTEMSLEQISAAEIRDFPHGLSPEALNKFLPGFTNLTSPLSLSNYDDEQSEDKHSRSSSVSSSTSVGSNMNSLSPYPSYSSFSASLAALEKQVKTMESTPKHLDDERRYGLIKPYSREVSPGVKCEEPEDLSKSSRNNNLSRSECDSSCDQNQNSDIEDTQDEEKNQRSENGSPPQTFSMSQMILPGQKPLLVPFSGIPSFPPLHHSLPSQLFHPMGFPNPLAHLGSPGGLHQPPGFQHLPLPFSGMRRKFFFIILSIGSEISLFRSFFVISA